MTTKQTKFCDEYLQCLDPKQAARAAGYSERTASEQGMRMLQHPTIKAVIEHRRRPIEADQIMTALECIRELCRIARDPKASNRDKIHALKLIGTYHGSFVKKIETAGPGEFAHLTDEEINSELRELAAERQGIRTGMEGKRLRYRALIAANGLDSGARA